MEEPKNISQEELSKLTKAMKDKQFQSHMDEYCKEISDPAHRKEYLQYLDQLEAKGEMPEGQGLLRSEPGMCVKTTIMFKNGQSQKCFINIVHSDRLEDMSEERDANGGKNVQLPYSLGPPRPERDNKDENCMTCDFAVSTWTFGQAIQRPQILKMLVDTASDGLSKQFLKGHEEVKKDFKVMRRIKCRGPGARPLPMSVNASLLKNKGKGYHRPTHTVEEKSAVTPSELREMRKVAKEKQLKPPAATPDEEEDAPKPDTWEPETNSKGAARIRVPKHRLVHSGVYDLTDFMESSNRPNAQLAASIPRMLKLVVELPSVKKSSDIVMEVTEYNVCIEVPDKYYLDLPLSYEIDHNNGNAKFDKVAQTLTLELPVVPKAPDPNIIGAKFSTEEEGETGEADGDGALSEGGESQEDLPPLEDVSAEAPAPEPEAVVSPPTPMQSPKAQPTAAPAADLVPEEELARFIASDSFAGARQGYFFSMGDDGLGYYRDTRQRRPERERPKEEKIETTALERHLAQTAGDGAPLIEEIVSSDYIPSGFTSAKSSRPAAPAKVAPLSRKVQQYIDTTTLLMSHVAPKDVAAGAADVEPTLDFHQTRQNLSLLVGNLAAQEVAGLQVSFVSRRLTITFCMRAVGSEKWHRVHLRRTLCRAVDPRQWHAEPPKQSEGTSTPLLIVLRKIEQERWPEVFDMSAAAVAAVERETVAPLISSNEPLICDVVQVVTDNTAAADTAAGIDVDVGVEDSAELDIAAPAGAAVSLGPAQPAGVKDLSIGGPSAPLNASAASAAGQSASVMGQSVLLRTRLMYQLF